MKYLPLLTALLCTPLAASAAKGFVPAPMLAMEKRRSVVVRPGISRVDSTIPAQLSPAHAPWWVSLPVSSVIQERHLSLRP